jgi:hypothetical protein
LAVQAGFAALDLISKPPNQHENDNDDQHGADDADATVSVAITISAEAATEAPKQENEQDDNENEPKRHDLFSLLLYLFSLLLSAILSFMPRRMLSKTAHK